MTGEGARSELRYLKYGVVTASVIRYLPYPDFSLDRLPA